MWIEYMSKYPGGLGRREFSEHYQQWCQKVNPVMNIRHKTEAKLFVDYAGKTLL